MHPSSMFCFFLNKKTFAVCDNNLGLCSSLIQESVAPMVVDGVLEDIRVCMEINHVKLNQRRVAMVKYLGELYNYRVVESNDIFKVSKSF